MEKKTIFPFLVGLIPGVIAFLGYTTWDDVPKVATRTDIEQVLEHHVQDDAQNDLELYTEKVDRLNRYLLDNKNYQNKYKEDSPAQETLKEQQLYLEKELEETYKKLERAEKKVYKGED